MLFRVARSSSAASRNLNVMGEKPPATRQQGIALLLILLIAMIGAITVFLTTWNSGLGRQNRERQTELALQQAKEALIAYAVSVDLSGSKRPGDLPCPDLNNDGRKETSCGNAAGSTGQSARLGRLPWKDLGLPDLRDGSGERLWYAVSNNFKENTRHFPLNSDTTGTIHVVDADGNVTPNIIAILIAPGEPLQRLDATAAQDRSAGNENDPTQYLDKASTEDNADFSDDTTNGFVSGIVRDATGRVQVNDRILVITYDDLFPLLEKRVAAEVMNCLTGYAATPNNNGRYPWAADLATSVSGTPTAYNDVSGTTFGRIPDLMCNTGSQGPIDPVPQCRTVVGTNPNMSTNWGSLPNCYIGNGWFTNNWREQVFYAVANGYKPGSGSPSCGSCLAVGTTSNVQIAIMLARKTLTLVSLIQDRTSQTSKATITNYLEGENATPYDQTFQAGSVSSTFNDLVLYR